MKKYLPILVLSTFMLPSVAFAAWWNPLSWNWTALFNNPAPTISQSSNLEVAATTSSSSTVAVTATSTVMVASTSVATSSTSITSLSITPKKVVKKVTQSVQASPVTPIQSVLAVQTTSSISVCPQGYTCAPVTTQPVVQPTPTVSSVSATVNQLPVVSSSATINISPSTPKEQSVEATDISDGQYLGLPILVFGVNPSGNDFYPNTLTVNVAASGQGTVGTAYLYQGIPGALSKYLRPIATAIVSNGVANFGQISNVTTAPVDFGAANPFTVAVDVSGLTTFGDTETISASIASFSLLDSKGNVVNATGSASGNAINVENDI